MRTVKYDVTERESAGVALDGGIMSTEFTHLREPLAARDSGVEQLREESANPAEVMVHAEPSPTDT